MKKLLSLTFLFTFIFSLQVSAQLRDDLKRDQYPHNTIVNTNASTIESSLGNFFMNNFSMSHSYTMSFGSIGGSFQNINAYTNTMQFAFSPQLTGRMDISFLHSPFGQSGMINQNNSLGGRVMIRNAELNYQISDKAHIRLQYQQIPGTFGLHNPYGYNRYNTFGHWY